MKDDYDPVGRWARLTRLKRVYARKGIDKEWWLANTTFSEAQWYRWHSENGTSPGIDQMIEIFRIADINQMSVWYDVGPDSLSDLRRLCDTGEQLNRIEEKIDSLTKPPSDINERPLN